MKNKEKDKNYFNLDKPEEKDVLVKITKDKFESKKSKYIIYRKNEFEVSKRTSFFETDELLQLILIEHKLKPSGMKMFLYVVGNLKFENDWIEIKKKEIALKYDITDRKVETGIRELIDLGILAKHRPTVNGYRYWINTKYLFNGNRLKYYKNNFPDKIRYLQPENTNETQNEM